MYKLLVQIVKFLLSWNVKVNVKGKENIPEKGPVIICINHVNLLDPLFIMFAINRDLWAMAASSYAKNPFVLLFLKMGRAILVNRGTDDQEALNKALKILQDSKFLGVSPEGTRSQSGILQRGKFGPAYLAGLSNASILPVGIVGSKDATKKIFRKKVIVEVVVGKYFKLQRIDNLVNKTRLVRSDTDIKQTMLVLRDWRDITNTQIMPRIAELLPEEMRGEFA